MRHSLKEIAGQLIRKGGYNAFSFRDLAAKNEIKSSTVHYYFPTKSDLVAEIANDYKDSFFERLNAESAGTKSVSKKLLCLINLYEESLANDLNCLCGMLASEIDLLSTKERQAVADFFNQLEKWLKETLADAKIKSGMNATEITYLLLSALNGAVILDRATTGRNRLNAIRAFIKKLI